MAFTTEKQIADGNATLFKRPSTRVIVYIAELRLTTSRQFQVSFWFGGFVGLGDQCVIWVSGGLIRISPGCLDRIPSVQSM
jgi:hypothetical protein